MPSLALPLSPLDPPELRERKGQLLALVGLEESFDCAAAAGIPERAVWRTRVLCMDEIELYAWYPFGGAGAEVVGFVSHWNELKTVRMLTDQVKKMDAPAPALAAELAAWCQRLTEATVAEAGEEHYNLLEGVEWDSLRGMLKGEGMALDTVSPAVFPETTGRGLVFARDVAASEPVVAIPRALLFTVEATYTSTLHPVFEQLGLDDDTRLLLFLMHEKFQPVEKSSCGGRWAPFIHLLPAAYSTLFFWTMDELAELQGSRLLGEAMDQKSHLQGVYTGLFPHLSNSHPDAFPPAVFTFENMLWARAVFDSRAFVLNIEGKKRNCLLPWAEYINHTNSAGHVSFRRFDADRQTMLLESLGGGRAGTQARMNYGPMQNCDLLLGYGFAMDANPLETAVINVDLADEEDPMLPFKNAAMGKLGIPADHLLGQRPAYHYLMAMLRIFHCETPEDIAKAMDGNACLKGPVDAGMEASVLDTFGIVIDSVLGEYPTSLSEDEARLAAMRAASTDCGNHTEILATSNVEFALVYRIGQKKVLHQALAWAATARAALQG